MNDFPKWFLDFSSSQLEGIENESENLELKSLEDLQIQYIKVWSVIETFSKILIILSEKRTCLKQIQPELSSLDAKVSEINRYKEQLEKLIEYYKYSISGIPLEELGFEAINAAKSDVMRKKFKKYSVLKNIVFKSNLPKKEVVDKALKVLEIDSMEFTIVLPSENDESRYYKTRNNIAHEGVVGISKKNFINDRFLIILSSATEINTIAEKF